MPERVASDVLPGRVAFVAAQGVGSIFGFLLLSSIAPTAWHPSGAVTALFGLLTLASLMMGVTRTSHDPDSRLDGLLLACSGMAIGAMAISTGYVLSFYAAIPVDIVSFAESSFVNDIIKLRAGAALYTPGVDNNAYPYMPGTQLLTYGLASLFGDPTSIALMRHIALGYVVLAAGFAAFAADRLILLGLPRGRRLRPLWWWIFACAAWLAATDPRFNMFVHSLHNDGLALLVGMASFAAAATHLHRPRAGTWVAMTLLPVVGYLVKQSLLIWSPLLIVILLISGRVSWRKVVPMALVAGLLSVLVTWYGYLNWGGDDFLFWVFSALGSKHVSPGRSVQNLLSAGGYVVATLLWVRVVLRDGTSRPMLALLLGSAGIFLAEAYTSGIGFTPNHLGPGVVLATLWGMLAMAAAWPTPSAEPGWWRQIGQRATLAVLPLFFVGGLGLVREPHDPVPADLTRYIADLDSEFAGMPAEQVLLDMGCWPYLNAGVVMKDRGDPVALHAGANQRAINRPMLAETIARIRARKYLRILARNIESDATPYDFQRRGTGVREAILEEYQIVRRIPAVKGVSKWWPSFLLDEVAVLEPRTALVVP